MRVNIFTEKQVRVWAELSWSEKEDLDLVMLQQDQVLTLTGLEPEPKTPMTFEEAMELPERKLKPAPLDPNLYPPGPPWFTEDILAQGLYEIIQPWEDNPSDDLPDWAWWGLQNGVAPFQPFELIFPRPYYWQSYEGDYDAEYYWHIGRTSPSPLQRTIYNWRRYLKSIGIYVKDLR